VRAGPKAEITAGPLDLTALPRSASRRVEQFACDYLKVTRGKGARGPFRLRAWQKEFVSRQHDQGGIGVRDVQAGLKYLGLLGEPGFELTMRAICRNVIPAAGRRRRRRPPRRSLTHSGDPDLARHVGNAVVRNDSRGHRIVKEHKDSTRRIDLAVAAVMAFATASRSTRSAARTGTPFRRRQR
jgi:hypothetical protein